MTRELFQQGFTGLDHEVRCDNLPTQGIIPDWLSGTLVRNGPAKFNTAAGAVDHWFDGLAMLHAFTFKNGQISYANRFLESRSYRQAMVGNKPSFSAFTADPCSSLFGRIFTVLFADADNANVNVARVADRFLALTETPIPVEFDPLTLRTIGDFHFTRPIPGDLTTAHPLYDAPRKALFNQTLRFGLVSSYRVYWTEGQRLHTIASLLTFEPSYMHSFGMTDRYIILSLFPFRVSPVQLITSKEAFIDCFRWRPELGMKLIVIDKNGEEPVRIYETESCFGFHHINAYESAGDIVVDLIAYANPSVIQMLQMDYVLGNGPLPQGQLMRYLLPKNGSASCERRTGVGIELPQINDRYRSCGYRFTYGVGARSSHDFMNQLVKLNVENGAVRTWAEAGCYPGEPVFVPCPDSRYEDGGIVLSVVLDTLLNTSFLLVLDGITFEEIGRAQVPHHIPFGFHGQFFEGVV